MAPIVSITAVLFNSAEFLAGCFEPIEEAVNNGFAELIVVDNNSPDESADIIKSRYSYAALISAPRNMGFAKACNEAWPKAAGRYWLLLNPDAILPADGLETLVKWMDDHQSVGAASPDIVNFEGGSEYPGRSFPSIFSKLLEISRLHLFLTHKFRGKLFRGAYWNEGDQTDTGWVTGTVMIVRREAIEKAGLLSEDFFMYGEDMEWCWRIKRCGWKIGVCDSVKASHHGSASAKKTWTRLETDERKRRGFYAALKTIKGRAYTYILVLIESMGLLIESVHPFRSTDERSEARKEFSINVSLLK